MDNFENIQLYRTNVLLGGNMKYDLILDDNGENLFVNDFHITPITGDKPYNYDDTKYLLDKSHQENVLEYYKANINNFYKEHINSKLNSNYPILYDEYNATKCYDDNWFMGLRRTPMYERYQKQFEFLLPLWLERVDDLIFEISIYTNDKLLTTKSLLFSATKNENMPKHHNDFCEYLYKYMRNIGIVQDYRSETHINTGETVVTPIENYGSNDVFNVNFTDYTAYLHGLNIISGRVESLFLNNKCEELMEREIPFLDFNMKITESFKDNKFIAKQLFNFNLCFNIQDLAAPQFRKILMYKDINIKVNVKHKYIDEKGQPKETYLTHKDFYTNYQFIPRKKPIIIENKDNKLEYPKDGNPENVLDFLEEYNCIDYVNYNKITQHNHMWSLVEEPTYIFNLYEGFAGSIINDSESHETSINVNNNGLAFEPSHKNYNEYLNNEYWCNLVTTDDVQLKFLEYYATHIEELRKYCSNVKNIHNDILFHNTEDKYVLLVCYTGTNSLTSAVKNSYHILHGEEYTNGLYYKKLANINIFVAADQKLLTYNKINKKLKLDLTQPKQIPLRKSVSKILIENSKHIEYILNDDYNYYLNRYDGKIKPTFITIGDDVYKNKIWRKNLQKIGAITIDSTINPIECIDLNYNKNIFINSDPTDIDDLTKYDYLGNNSEYCWFNDSNFTLLPTFIQDDYHSSKLTSPYTIALEYLSKIFKGESYDMVVKSQDNKDMIKASFKVINILHLYNINVEFMQNKYEIVSDKIYKDTYTQEEFNEEKDIKYKYYKIQLKLK